MRQSEASLWPGAALGPRKIHEADIGVKKKINK